MSEQDAPSFDHLVSDYYPPNFENPQDALDTHLRLQNDLVEYLYQPVPERNFEVKTNIQDNEERILLVHQDGRQIDMGQFLAPGYKFVPSWDFRLDPLEMMEASAGLGSKEVKVDSEAYEFRGGVLTLLHEIGHTYQDPEELMLTKGERIRSHVESLGSLSKTIIKSQVLQREKYKKLKKEHPEEYPHQIQLEAQPALFHELKDIKRAQKERDAWAYAIYKGRELSNIGFDVFAGFDSAKEITDFAHACLFSYEYSRLHRIYKRDGNKALQKHKPLFVRNRNLPSKP